MKRIVLVDSQAERAATMAERLSELGVQVTVAEDGFFALTMLERLRPDLILTREELADMRGAEFCAIVRKDFSLRGLPVLLLWNSPQRQTEIEELKEFDQVFDGEEDFDALAWQIRSWDGREAGPEVVAAEAALKTLAGSLTVLSFSELTQALSQTHKTGVLSLESGTAPGLVYYVRGQIIHCTWESWSGRLAFARVYHANSSASDRQFSFTPKYEDDMAEVPRSINLTADQLLLMVAVDFDEHGNQL